MAENDDFLTARSVLFGEKVAPDERLIAKQGKEIVADAGAGYLFGLFVSGYHRHCFIEGRDAFKRFRARLPDVYVAARNGHLLRPGLWFVLPQPDRPLRVAVW